jgi:aspartate kinase
MKFGGTSLEDAQAFQRVAHIVSSHASTNLMVVVSAMSGVTDTLISSFQGAAKGQTSEVLRTLESLFERHLEVTFSMRPIAAQRMRAVIYDSRRDIIELLGEISANRRTIAEGQDAMASHGERLSANLLTIVLEDHGIPASYVDARRCIVTDENHGSAEPFIEETWRQTRALVRPLLETRKVPVLGGFIGASRNGVTTTLGRGSSDYSATLFSAALGARETQIWTDVDGVMTADPCLVESASPVSRLSYEEAAELAGLGARVLHSKMIQPAIGPAIPIRILNSGAPQRTGTVIRAGASAKNGTVKAIAHKTGLTRIDVTSTPAFVANGFLGAIKDIFNSHRVQIQIVGSSDVGVSFACEEASALPSLVQDLQQVGSVKTKKQRAIVSCVGEGLHSAANSGKLLNLLREIDPELDWQSTSSLNLISTIDAERVGTVVRQIHQRIFEAQLNRQARAIE